MRPLVRIVVQKWVPICLASQWGSTALSQKGLTHRGRLKLVVFQDPSVHLHDCWKEGGQAGFGSQARCRHPMYCSRQCKLLKDLTLDQLGTPEHTRGCMVENNKPATSDLLIQGSTLQPDGCGKLDI